MELNKKILFNFLNKKIILMKIKKNSINDNYLKSINNEKYLLANKENKFNYISQEKYIKDIHKSKKKFIFGFWLNNKFIGTAGLQNNIDGRYIGMLIFDKKSRGKGLGKIIIWSLIYLLNKTLKYRVFYAGVDRTNTKSLKVFKSLGFKIFYAKKDFIKLKLNFNRIKFPKNINNIKIIKNNEK